MMKSRGLKKWFKQKYFGKIKNGDINSNSCQQDKDFHCFKGKHPTSLKLGFFQLLFSTYLYRNTKYSKVSINVLFYQTTSTISEKIDHTVLFTYLLTVSIKRPGLDIW